MPWKITKRGDQHCVVKSDDGSTVKCHATRADALDHMRALYVNVKTSELGIKSLAEAWEQGIDNWLSNAGEDELFIEDDALFTVAFAAMKKKRKEWRPGYNEATELAEYGASWEDTEKQVYKAVCAWARTSGYISDYYLYNFATYSNHVVAECDGEFWDFPYTISGGEVTVSEPTKVARDYKPVKAHELALTEDVVTLVSIPNIAEFGEGKPIQIMRTGTFDHPEYGEFTINDSDLSSIVRNFNAKVRGQDIPIDIDHIHEGGAVGWIKGLVHHKDGTLWATPEWTDEGEALLDGGKFKYFSPHFGPWKDPESGHEYNNVLWSGAVTNFPFLKGMEAIALTEFHERARESKGDNVVELSEAQEQIKLLQERLTATEAAKTESDTVVAALTESNKKMADNVATIQHDAMVRRCSDIVHGNGDPNKRWVTANEEQTITLVVKLAEDYGEDSDVFKQFVSEKDADSTRVRASEAMSELGVQQTVVGVTPVSKLPELNDFEAEVTKLLAEGTAKTRPDAQRMIAGSHPDLYNRYRAAQIKPRS